MTNYYEKLGINEDATTKRVREAYLELAWAWHPDNNNMVEAPRVFTAITQAYKTLVNPNSRRAYTFGLSA